MKTEDIPQHRSVVPSLGRGVPTKASSLIQRGLALGTPERNRQEAEAYCGWGCASLLLGQEQLDKAIQYFTQAMQEDPDYALAYYGRALAYRHLGQWPEAVHDFTHAFRLTPHYRETYYSREGFTDDALMTKVPQGHEKFHDLYEPYCSHDGQWQQEIQELTKTIESYKPRERYVKEWWLLANMYYSRALAYRHCGQWQEALRDFTRAAELYPYQPPKAYYTQESPCEFASEEGLFYDAYNQGRAYAEQGQYYEAIQSLTYAITLWNWAADGHWKLRSCLAGYVAGYEVYYARGLAYAHLGLWEQARQDFSEVIRFMPEHTEAYYCRAISQRHLGQWEQACKDYQHADRLENGSTYWRTDLSSSTVSKLSFTYVQWSQEVTLFPVIEACKFVAL